MNEVTKLYENVGFIQKRCKDYSCIVCDKNKDCDKYPPFTAEKLIELIKWLSDTDYYIHNIYKTIDTKEYCIENDFYDIQTNKFEEALARLINKLWQDLTEEERKQIKEILE